MKRVKLILSAIAVFAVVGTALAFKAKSSGNLYCATAQNEVCITTTGGVLVRYTQAASPAPGSTLFCIPTSVGEDCSIAETTFRVTVNQ